MNSTADHFYIIAREPGAENPAIPTWACRIDNPAALNPNRGVAVTRQDIDRVPGAFQLLNLLSADECTRLLELSERCGYLGDAAVSLGRDIRHNDSFTWIADDETCAILWRRCADLVEDQHEYNRDKPALGLNGRWRFYRYGVGDYFAPHTDGSWPGSRIVDGELRHDAYGDRWSQYTILLFLSDAFEGGATRFFSGKYNPGSPVNHAADAAIVDVRTPLGAALCFPHGTHPQHCLHASEEIRAGCKYIIRSDVLFAL